jgi:Pyruvate/2-oxoacid:ferredoxin oxidoreductase gamma subunit
MQEQFVFSGFGGQGVMFVGQLLAYAAMDNGFEVTWIPSYGPEMRGGTAHCTVVISDRPIGSPIVQNPKVAVAFNNPSFDKYVSASEATSPHLRFRQLNWPTISVVSSSPTWSCLAHC